MLLQVNYDTGRAGCGTWRSLPRSLAGNTRSWSRLIGFGLVAVGQSRWSLETERAAWSNVHRVVRQ